MTNMNSPYYLTRNGETFGPYEWSDIWRFGQEGNLHSGDNLWSEALVTWTPVEKIESLKVFFPVTKPRKAYSKRLFFLLLAMTLLSGTGWLLYSQLDMQSRTELEVKLADSSKEFLELAKAIFRKETGQEPTLENLEKQGAEHQGDSSVVDRAASSKDISSTPSFEVTPQPGITIRAENGALDRAREFKVTPFAATRLDPIFFKAAGRKQFIVGAYDFDAGMKESDRFQKPVEFRFDLKKLGIPEHAWDEIYPARLDSSGDLGVLRRELQGGILTMKTLHNSPIILVGIPAILIGAGYLVWDDLKVLPEGALSNKKFSEISWPPGNGKITLKYPFTWRPADAGEVTRVLDELKTLWEKFQAGRTRAQRLKDWFINAFFDFVKEPEYQRIKKLTRSREFLLKNALPKKVGLVAIAMERGIEYLENRGFRNAGWMGFEWMTEIFVLDKSLGPDCYGNAVNPKLTRGYIEIDGTKIPDCYLDELTYSKASRKEFDALQTTAVHEYFHIMQSAYTNIEWASYLWFFEAAAVTLEGEAGTYFQRKGWAKKENWDDTQREDDVFFDPMDKNSGDATGRQQHGYGQSFFLEALRDKFYKSSSTKFLPRLMNDFSGMTSDPLKAIQTSCDLDGKKFSVEFVNFAQSLYPNLLWKSQGKIPPIDGGTTLSPGTRRVVYPHNKEFPVSARGLVLTLKEDDFEGIDTDKISILARDSSSSYSLLTNEVMAGNSKKWFPVKPGSIVTLSFPPILAHKAYVFLKRISPTWWGFDLQGATEVFLVLPPDKGVEFEKKNNHLRLRPSQSPLAALKPPYGLTPYIEGYEICIQSKEGGEIQTFQIEPKKASEWLELPIAPLIETIKKGPKGETRIRFWHREIIRKNPKIISENGPISELNLNASTVYVNVTFPGALPDIQFSVSGDRVGGIRRGYFTKKGKILFTETRVISGSVDEKTGQVTAIVAEKNKSRDAMRGQLLFKATFNLNNPSKNPTGAINSQEKTGGNWSERKISVMIIPSREEYDRQLEEQTKKNNARGAFTVWEFIDDR